MQGVGECALLTVEQRCIQHPAKTGTFAFPKLKEAPLQKKHQTSLFLELPVLFFFF